MTSANDIRCALRLRYPANSHALLWEVANSTGAYGHRYADAVAVGLWPSHGHEIEGVEIKVSRSDFLHEMKQPEKSQPVFRYCNRWWLAAPKGLVTPDELPTTWGLLELVGDSMRVKKKAPALEPDKPSIGFLASLLRRHAGADEDMTSKLLKDHAKEIREQFAKANKSARESNKSYHAHSIESANKKLDEIKEATGFDFRNDHRPSKQWIAALKFLIGSSYDQWFTASALERVREQCIATIKTIDAMPLGVKKREEEAR